jgi:hypothetical protein
VSEINVHLVTADAREDRTVTAGTKAWELFAEEPDVIAARVGGELRDLAHELGEGDEVEAVTIDSKDGHDILRHSTAHVMAQAVQELFPDAKLGIGPTTTSTSRPRSCRRTSRRSRPGCARSSRRTSASSGVRSLTTRLARSWPVSPTSSSWSG